MGSPLDDTVIVYDRDKQVYEPSPYSVDDLLGGEGASGSRLIIPTGQTVTLDDSKTEGTLLGYRVKTTCTFSSSAGEVELPSGVYTFEKTLTGWTYYVVADGTELVPPTPEPAWSLMAADPFTASDGTVVNGRTTPTGSKVWTLSSGPEVTIVGNKIPWSATGYTGQELRLALGSDHTDGVAIEWDYTNGFKAGVAINSPPHWAGLELDGGNLYAAGGYPPTNLSGTTSGLPSSGRARIEVVGTTLTFFIDGVQRATATTLPLKGDYVCIVLTNGSSADSVEVEVYS